MSGKFIRRRWKVEIMSRDDKEQLEYIENWKREQVEKKQLREKKKMRITYAFHSCMMNFKWAFKDLYICIKACFK